MRDFEQGVLRRPRDWGSGGCYKYWTETLSDINGSHSSTLTSVFLDTSDQRTVLWPSSW